MSRDGLPVAVASCQRPSTSMAMRPIDRPRSPNQAQERACRRVLSIGTSCVRVCDHAARGRQIDADVFYWRHVRRRLAGHGNQCGDSEAPRVSVKRELG